MVISSGRHLLLVATISILICGCSSDPKRELLSHTNLLNAEVQEQSERLAQAMYALPGTASEPSQFDGVLQVYGEYRLSADALSTQIMELGQVFPELSDHLGSVFEADMTVAMNRCDTSSEALSQSPENEATYRESLVEMALCVEQYANATTRVAREFSRLVSE
jgi:hypothetical protein